MLNVSFPCVIHLQNALLDRAFLKTIWEARPRRVKAAAYDAAEVPKNWLGASVL